jgi:excisionase family DNA binding protein
MTSLGTGWVTCGYRDSGGHAAPGRGGEAAVRDSRLLTAGQVAERWQVPTGHVYRLAREGRIPAVRLGRYYRFRVDALERWELRDARVAAGEEGT